MQITNTDRSFNSTPTYRITRLVSLGLLDARNTGPDPRLVFLERASARLFLVEAGEMNLDEAFEGLVASLECSCTRELVQRWERQERICRRGKAAHDKG
jgi:hypothetical protein